MTDGDGNEHTVYVRFGPVAGFIVADIVSALTVAGIAYLYWRKNLPTKKENKDEA